MKHAPSSRLLEDARFPIPPECHGHYVANQMIKRSIKYLIYLVGHSVGKSPRLKSLSLKAFDRFPVLKRKLIYIVKNTKHTQSDTIRHFADLSPSAREIYGRLTGRRG